MLKAKSGKRQPVMRRKGSKDNVPAPKDKGEKGKPGLMIMIGAPKKPPMPDEDEEMEDEEMEDEGSSNGSSKDMQLILAKLDALSARLAALEAVNA